MDMNPLPNDWQELMDKNPMWILEVQPSGLPFKDIEMLLFWFKNGQLTVDQLSDAFDEYEFHCDVRYSLMACRHAPLVVLEKESAA